MTDIFVYSYPKKLDLSNFNFDKLEDDPKLFLRYWLEADENADIDIILSKSHKKKIVKHFPGNIINLNFWV